MKRLCLSLLVLSAAHAAPLFPAPWWKDAEAVLRGYPDGTFKGDRAASRWEVALLVARLLRQQAPGVDRKLLVGLADGLKEELQELGVRVENLERDTGELDKRVQELERITFYGQMDARVISQNFYPQGDTHNLTVGSNGATTIRPQTHGIVPVVDYRNGRALVSGAGFTSRALLGLKIRVSEELDAGAEFVAYTSQGSAPIDAYLGIPAPQAINPFLANNHPGSREQGSNGAQLNRVILDNFWVRHKPSETYVRLGAVDKLRIDRFVYTGLPNLGVFGPARFPGVGFTANGKAGDFRWEVFSTRWGDANVFQSTNYDHHTIGADLSYEWKTGQVQLDYARYFDDFPGAGALPVGITAGTNVPYFISNGWNPVQWVNPPGDWTRSAPLPNTNDTRPIPGWNANADNAVGLGAAGGNYGPAAQTTWGMSAHQNLDGWKFTLELASSDFKPNRNSPYSAGGFLGAFEVATKIDQAELALRYQRVDPTYNPSLFPGPVLGLRAVRPFNFVGRGFLFDNGNYTHNREGMIFSGKYDFLSWKVGYYQQVRTSLYDVRYLGTNPVLGFSPGWFDSVFAGFAHPGQYGSRSASSFTDTLQPLENPRGRQFELGLGFNHQLTPDFKISGAAEHNRWDRPTSLTPGMGGSQNRVKVRTNYFNAGLSWKVDPTWTVRAGCDWIHLYGHHDPAGLFNDRAVAANSTDFDNLNSLQTIPVLGFEAQLGKNASISTDFRYFFTDDAAQSFSWSGPQLISEFHYSF